MSTSGTTTPFITRSTPLTAHPTPPLTESSLREPPEADRASAPRPKANRRRDKPKLSCNACRRRKLRCDRQQPCSSCASRSQSCTYTDNAAGPWPLRPPPVAGVHDRLVQLERLVMSLMSDSVNTVDSSKQGGLSAERGSSSSEDVLPGGSSIDENFECGSMRVSTSELRYIGGDHWAAILDSIADLKDHFDRDEQLRLASSPDPIQENNGDSRAGLRRHHALLLYGCRKSGSRMDILSALPPRAAVDRYISRYFNRLDLVSSAAVHGPSFIQQYESFWINPSSVPVAWLGLLFSMICLAELVSDVSESLPGTESEQRSLQIDLYRERTVQCLLAAEYTRSGPYVLETMIHYVYIEFCLHSDADKDLWFLLALEVNLAMRMGYHRDPSHFSGISPLQGEMRRRLWATVLMSDILISSQMGMPRMISDQQYDTVEPRNLNDNDLDEDTIELPPSRPETEQTTTLGVIARRRILVALGIVSDLTTAIQPCNYADIMRVDSILRDAAASIPPPLRMKSMAASVTDSPQVIMARLFISHMLYKGQIMLHRRFLFRKPPALDENNFAYSRNVCLDACFGTLQIQHLLDEETCPGGQLHMMRWRVTSSMNHLFLTATMILCSLLHREQTLDQVEEIQVALRNARTIWMRRSSISHEAKMAAETVSIVLAKTRGVCRDENDLDNGPTDGITIEPGINIYSAVSNSSGVGLEAQNMIGLWESDPYTMPDLFGRFTLTGQQDQNFPINIQNMRDRNAESDDWEPMNWSGVDW